MTDLLPPAALASPATLSSLAMPLRFHPAREALFNELHTRPFPVLQTPSNLAHLVLLRDDPSAPHPLVAPPARPATM